MPNVLKCAQCNNFFFQHQPTPSGHAPHRPGVNNSDIRECTTCIGQELPGDVLGMFGYRITTVFAAASASLLRPSSEPGTMPTSVQVSSYTEATIQVPINYTIYDPTIDPNLSSANKITLGDLHGNTMTLFIIALKCGLLIPKSSVNTWEAFNEISRVVFNATNGPLDINDYKNFITKINEFDVNLHAPSLRLLGDVLADRVSNDVLTLALLQRLIHANKISCIVYSNHDNELFIYLAACGAEPIPYFIPDDFIGSHLKWRDFMANMADEAHHDILREVFENLNAYISVLKMFDYEYPIRHADAAIPSTRDFCLYSHASFDWPRFQVFIDLLRDPRQLRPQVSLPALMSNFIVLIEQSNVWLKALLQSVYDEALEILYGAGAVAPRTIEQYEASEFAQFFAPDRPGYDVIWYRWDRTLEPVKPPLFPNLYNVHGHDLNSLFPNGKTYDQQVGKTIDYLHSPQTFFLELEVLT